MVVYASWSAWKELQSRICSNKTAATRRRLVWAFFGWKVAQFWTLIFLRRGACSTRCPEVISGTVDDQNCGGDVWNSILAIYVQLKQYLYQANRYSICDIHDKLYVLSTDAKCYLSRATFLYSFGDVWYHLCKLDWQRSPDSSDLGNLKPACSQTWKDRRLQCGLQNGLLATRSDSKNDVIRMQNYTTIFHLIGVPHVGYLIYLDQKWVEWLNERGASILHEGRTWKRVYFFQNENQGAAKAWVLFGRKSLSSISSELTKYWQVVGTQPRITSISQSMASAVRIGRYQIARFLW